MEKFPGGGVDGIRFIGFVSPPGKAIEEREERTAATIDVFKTSLVADPPDERGRQFGQPLWMEEAGVQDSHQGSMRPILAFEFQQREGKADTTAGKNGGTRLAGGRDAGGTTSGEETFAHAGEIAKNNDDFLWGNAGQQLCFDPFDNRVDLSRWAHAGEDFAIRCLGQTGGVAWVIEEVAGDVGDRGRQGCVVE